MDQPINPVEASAFVGIDPDDTLDVPYGGGTFTLGVLPVALWDRLRSRSMVNYQNTIRRVTAAIHARGDDPTFEVSSRNGKPLTLLDQEFLTDPVYTRDQFLLHLEAVKYGLRGHKNFKNKVGKEFPFEVVSSKLDGYEVSCLSEKTLRVYLANSELLQVLWFGMRQLHDLSDSAKKA